MHSFTVWAPDAGNVVVQVGVDDALGEHPLRRADGGWWAADIEDAGHGSDYAFRVDVGPSTPNPRRVCHPPRAHGPTRVCDASPH